MNGMIFEPFARFAAACSKPSFFGIPAWYQYLKLDPAAGCQVTSFNPPGDLILVALAVVDMLLHLAGLAAVVYVIYGGIQYTLSQGNPDATSKAQSAILNALIGLALAVVAIGFVSFLGKRIA